ncbi:MAG: hypothetical protein ACNA7O_19035 [Rhodobacterales bacterium]
MTHEEFEALQSRIEARAYKMWTDAGEPEGGPEQFEEDARELVALAEVGPPTLDPKEAARPVVEEASIQANLGEFPTMRDQGDEKTFPDRDQSPVEDSVESHRDGEAKSRRD